MDKKRHHHHRYHRIPANLKRFVQSHYETQEKKEIEHFKSFTMKLHTVYLSIVNLLHERIPHSTAYAKTPFIHLITKREIETMPTNETIDEIVLQKAKSILEFVEILAFCSLVSLKRVESLASLETLYQHFGLDFETTHRFLLSSNEKEDELILAQFDPALKTFLKERVYEKEDHKSDDDHCYYFFESLRPIELRWLSVQPQRFLQLVDQKINTSVLINHHLVFIRNLSDLELTFLIHLPEESWINFIQALDSTTHHYLFSRFNVFGLCTISCLINNHGNTFQSPDPLSVLIELLGPFLPSFLLDRLQEIYVNTPDIPSLAANLLDKEILGPFLDIQLLEEEQEWTRILLQSFPLNETKKQQNEYSSALFVNIMRDICIHTHFLSAWKDLKQEINVAQEITIFHPYWKDLYLCETRQLHESASDFIKEAVTFQNGLAQKNYYPDYYTYYNYFVVAWVVAIVIVVLFIIALSAYGIHRTQVIRVTATTATSKKQQNKVQSQHFAY